MELTEWEWYWWRAAIIDVLLRHFPGRNEKKKYQSGIPAGTRL
jgi:hypothetical protein